LIHLIGELVGGMYSTLVINLDKTISGKVAYDLTGAGVLINFFLHGGHLLLHG
jgi:hypothetical protein